MGPVITANGASIVGGCAARVEGDCFNYDRRYPTNSQNFALLQADGTTTTYVIATGLATTGNTAAYAPGATVDIGLNGTSTKAEVATQVAARINAGTDIDYQAHINSDNNVLVTQKTAGTLETKQTQIPVQDSQ